MLTITGKYNGEQTYNRQPYCAWTTKYTVTLQNEVLSPSKFKPRYIQQ